MANKRITELAAAGSLPAGTQLIASILSATVKRTDATISFDASDHSIRDSANGFVAAGFVAGDQVKVTGAAAAENNVFSATVTSVTAGKLVTNAAGIVTAAAGPSVTVTRWDSNRVDLATLASAIGGGGAVETIVPGTGISVDDSDPANPIVAATGSSTVNITPDTHPSSPNAADDEFEYGSSIDTAGLRAGGATAWAWVNQGAATAVVSGGSLVLAQGAQSTSDNLRCVMQPVSGSTWRFRAKVTLFGQRASADSSATAGIIFAGLCARNSTSGKLLSVHILSNAADTKPGRIEANRWTNVTTYSATYAATKDIFRGDYWNPRALVTLYLEIEQTSTQFLTRWSDSGVDGTFIPLTAENLSTHISSIDEVGIFHANTLNQTHTPKSATVVDWWRRMA